MPPSDALCAKRLATVIENINALAEIKSAGVRFTINRDGNRAGTIGLRVSHTDSYVKIIQAVSEFIRLEKCESFLDQITVNKSYKPDKTTNRRVFQPKLRTVYVIFRPPRKVFAHLSTTLATVKGYGAVERIEDALVAVEY
jgi:hypothetical protein